MAAQYVRCVIIEGRTAGAVPSHEGKPAPSSSTEKKGRSMNVGGSDYREGAKQRLEEAGVLLRTGLFSGSVYLAGRAVEGMLRALIWRQDSEYATGKKTLDTGHDLRNLLELAESPGIMAAYSDRDLLKDDVQMIARLWLNNMRFVPDRKLRDYWYNIRELNNRRSLKQASGGFYDACSAIVKRCEVICNDQ